jgi:menaquinone-dependent protoporphyrinogen oxidase
LKVLVAYASKHGSTKGIADFIAGKIREKGFQSEALDVDQVNNVGDYDAFVIGSALYIGHWMKEAKRFVSRNKSFLSTKPVWLFSSGPTGKEKKNAKGRDLLDPSVSGPFELEQLKKEIRVIDHRIFFGAFNPKDQGFFTRQLMKSVAIRDATPIGDFRDWSEIEGWVNRIAESLQNSRTAVVVQT